MLAAAEEKFLADTSADTMLSEASRTNPGDTPLLPEIRSEEHDFSRAAMMDELPIADSAGGGTQFSSGFSSFPAHGRGGCPTAEPIFYRGPSHERTRRDRVGPSGRVSYRRNPGERRKPRGNAAHSEVKLTPRPQFTMTAHPSPKHFLPRQRIGASIPRKLISSGKKNSKRSTPPMMTTRNRIRD